MAPHRAFCARDLSGSELLALFLDAVYLPTRPRGEKEGVLVAWGYTMAGRRELVAVRPASASVTKTGSTSGATSPGAGCGRPGW
jgi:transposase-like protein